MEIVLLLLLNWQGKAWYSLWFIFITFAMRTLSVFSVDALPPSSAEGTTFGSSMKAHSPSVATEMQPFSARDLNCLPFEDLFDEGWWEGAEEFDLTLPFEDRVEENLGTPSNETEIGDIDCEFFLHFPPPPKWMDLPPPPMPRNLKDMERLLQDLKQKPGNIPKTSWNPINLSEREMYNPTLKEGETRGQCSLCDWANGGNQTLNLFAKRQSESTARVGRGLIGALIGVTFVSAALGAALMRLFLRCRSGSSLEFFTNPCSISVRMRNWPKQSSANIPNQTEAVSAESTKPEPSSGMEWAVKRWRRSSSQAPLHPLSSSASENSYVEEYSVNNCKENSAVYAELEPDHRFPTNHVSQHKLTAAGSAGSNKRPRYDNKGYASSETPLPPPPPSLSPPLPEAPKDSPVGSTSTPSSAYYSDISSGEMQPNSQVRTIGMEGGGSIKAAAEPSGGPTISSRVQFQPVEFNIDTCYKPPPALISGESGPFPLQLLPRHLLGADPDPELMNSSAVWDRLDAAWNLPHQLKIDISQSPSRQTLHSIDNYNANTSSKTQTLSPKMNYNNLCPGDRIAKPLPPLPSRRVNGPERRRLKDSVVDQATVVTLPSKSV